MIRSPKHPALFVTANISGELGLWNLNHSMEEPFTPPVKVSHSICVLSAGSALVKGNLVQFRSSVHELAASRPEFVVSPLDVL